MMTLLNSNLFIGTAREICSLHRNLESREIAVNPFTAAPCFNMDRHYGISIRREDADGNPLDIPEMSVVTADMALAILCDQREGY